MNLIDRKRVICVAIGIFALFSLLLIQFFKIQIIEGDKWREVANKQHYFTVKEPFLRGTFISNTSIKKGHPNIVHHFVVDIQKFHLFVDPDSIPPELKEEISSHLQGFLDLSKRESQKFRLEFEKKSRSRKLASWLDSEVVGRVNHWWLSYARLHKIPRNAIFFVSDYQRSYPFGKLLGQVLHTVREERDEKTNRALPTGGLELYFDSYLAGKEGKRLLMRSPRHSLETGKVLELPKNGADIELTINHYLQAIAEEEIAKGVQKAKGKHGWAVMMDPKTGEILALAQYPFFYPPDYKNYFNDPRLTERTAAKASTDANEPGSIMKAITVAIALKANEELRARGEKELFSPEEKIKTTNGFFPGRGRKPITDTTTHYYLNMYMGLQKSSNIYVGILADRIVQRLGNDWYRNALQEIFGFGKKTGIELPAESAGVLPTPRKKHANGALEWSLSTPYSLAMGHNIQATTLQMLRAYAVLANGGYLVKPTLLRKITRRGPDGKSELLVDNTTSKRGESFPKVLSKEIVAEVVKALRYVTKPGGTSRRADIPGFTEAGKTSTAKKIVNGAYSETQYVAGFVGFAPVNDPLFVLMVVIDEPEYGYVPGIGKKHHGGTCAAPVFKEIAKRAFEYLGTQPDDPHGYPAGDPRYNPDKADWVKETRLLQEIYEKWNSPTKGT
jgi:cell division protein FtsI (penicillin-binding protein 3)